MDYKKSTYVTLLLLTAFAWFYALSINISTSGSLDSSVGPSYFPNVLAVIMTILCVISFIQTARMKEKVSVGLPYFRYILITLAVIALFLISWGFIGYFYIQGFIFLLILMFIYQKNFSKKQIAFNIALSLLVNIIIYLVFDVAMSIPL